MSPAAAIAGRDAERLNEVPMEQLGGTEFALRVAPRRGGFAGAPNAHVRKRCYSEDAQ